MSPPPQLQIQTRTWFCTSTSRNVSPKVSAPSIGHYRIGNGRLVTLSDCTAVILIVVPLLSSVCSTFCCSAREQWGALPDSLGRVQHRSQYQCNFPDPVPHSSPPRGLTGDQSTHGRQEAHYLLRLVTAWDRCFAVLNRSTGEYSSGNCQTAVHQLPPSPQLPWMVGWATCYHCQRKPSADSACSRSNWCRACHTQPASTQEPSGGWERGRAHVSLSSWLYC